MNTLIEMLERAAARYEKIGMVFVSEDGQQETAVTYAVIAQRAKAVAAYLAQKKQLKLGDRALVVFPPGLDFIIGYFGCLYAGVIAVPVIPPIDGKTAAKLKLIIDDVQPSAYLTNSDFLSTLNKMQLTRYIPQRVLAGIADQQTVHSRKAAKFNFSALDWLDIHKIATEKYAQRWVKPAPVNAETLAFLQYTSGSTGHPKGVMVSHGNLLHNLSLIERYTFAFMEKSPAFQTGKRGVVVSWVPPYHDMGLIGGILWPIYCERIKYVVLISPLTFLKDPSIWLRKLSEHQAMVTPVPNFALDLCVKRLKTEAIKSLDLSHLCALLLGAEPIRPQSLQRFSEVFGAQGFNAQTFYPCYGLAESTLIVSATSGETRLQRLILNKSAYQQNCLKTTLNAEDAQEFIGSGQLDSSIQIRMVHPDTKEIISDNQPGEIWLMSPSVAKGYWNKPEATQETFQAYTADGQGPFLRTGDLGFMREGELYISGRYKDLIIVAGKNYYPQDIEAVAEATDENILLQDQLLRKGCCAAFSIENENQEALVVILETRDKPTKVQAERIFTACQEAILEDNGLMPYVLLLVPPKTLQKTTSGKIMRHAAKAAFLAQTLQAVAYFSKTYEQALLEQEKKTEEASLLDDQPFSIKTQAQLTEIENKLIELLRALLHLDSAIEITPTDKFAKFGVNSIIAMELKSQLQKTFHLTFNATAVFNYPTIEKLAKYIHQQLNASTELINSYSHPFTSKSLSEEEPIAIIGMQGYFPGSGNLEQYWSLLAEGKSAVTEIPASRYTLYNTAKKKTFAPYAGLLNHPIEEMDAAFFNISPGEAEMMDPQQRLLLEVVWGALENAGVNPDHLKGQPVGVFMGMSSNDYLHLINQQNTHDLTNRVYIPTGNALSTAIGRLSYFLDLQGPNIPVDTACSSSLVALHLACASLKRGESTMALAGGVNVLLAPEGFAYFSEAGMLSPTGGCKTFDAKADGYTRGEGCGVVVLKRLNDALAAGDTIHAVIKGSAINQDGATSTLTAPNGLAQERVIQAALHNAGISPNEIDYVETHGTGTKLGDPIEVEAVGHAHGQYRTAKNPLYLGAVKASIGHLEAAAGIAGLIKLVLSLKHQIMPPQYGFEKANPHMNLEEANLVINTKPKAWNAREEHIRRAGISSYGFSGTNAHVIVEEAPEDNAVYDYLAEENQPYLLALSAKTPEALEALRHCYIEYLKKTNNDIKDIAFTAAVGRTHFDYRVAVMGHAKEELITQLQKNTVLQHQAKQITFLFTGQGSQYATMGQELYATQPVFRATLNECAALLKDELPLPFYSVLWGEHQEFIHQTHYAQPLLFAIEYALAKWWMHLGVTPQQLLGHSVGEFVAATIAGIMTLSEALKLIAARGRLMQALPKNIGGMLAIQLSSEEAITLINNFDLHIAGMNAPKQTVISGNLTALHALKNICDEKNIKATFLSVSHAFHSRHMQSILAEFKIIADSISYQLPQIPIISTVTGQMLQNITADYWCEQLVNPVNYLQAIQTAAVSELQLYLEIGPAPVLIALGQQCIATSENRLWCFSLKPNTSNMDTLLKTLGQCYQAGQPIQWSRLYAGNNTYYRKVSLPHYPFQRKRYWILEREKSLPASTWSEFLLPDIFNRVSKNDVLETLQVGKPHLEQLAFSYILDFFHQAGWSWEVSTQFTTQEAQQALSILSIHAKLFCQLLNELKTEGFLTQENAYWCVLQGLPSKEIIEEKRQAALHALEAYQDLTIEKHLLARCGANLHAVLTGKSAPLELLFPQDKTEAQRGSATALYQEGVSIQMSNTVLAQTVCKIIETTATNTTIRLLEIGAGTGGSTRAIITALKQANIAYEYTYTDISLGFFLAAKEIFGEERMLYRKLNIEKDPKTQGFLPYYYDMIIASNVLHATQNLPETLTHTRQLLVPHGALLLLELSQSSRFLDLTFGLLEGWWRFDDILRQDHALLNAAQWQKALLDRGFDHVAVGGDPLVIFAEANQEGKAYVNENTTSKIMTPLGQATQHPLLGYQLPLAIKNTVYQQVLTGSALAMLAKHQVLDYALMPAAGFIELFLATAQHYFPEYTTEIQHIALKETLLLEAKTITLQIIIEPQAVDHVTVTVYSLPEKTTDMSAAKVHAVAQIKVISELLASRRMAIQEIQERCQLHQDQSYFYETVKRLGYAYQDLFQCVQSVHYSSEECLVSRCAPWKAKGRGA